MSEFNTNFMKIAIKLSEKNLKLQYWWPFWAIIVKNWNIIWKWFNHVLKNNDPTAHAEIMAIRDACKNLKSFDLSWCEIFTSCEPCPMCLWAIYRARINKIYYWNTQKDADKIWFDDTIFYEELKKNKENRDIKMKQLLYKESNEIFTKRKNMFWQKNNY